MAPGWSSGPFSVRKGPTSGAGKVFPYGKRQPARAGRCFRYGKGRLLEQAGSFRTERGSLLKRGGVFRTERVGIVGQDAVAKPGGGGADGISEVGKAVGSERFECRPRGHSGCKVTVPLRVVTFIFCKKIELIELGTDAPFYSECDCGTGAVVSNCRALTEVKKPPFRGAKQAFDWGGICD
jgi:hypothetical protein